MVKLYNVLAVIISKQKYNVLLNVINISRDIFRIQKYYEILLKGIRKAVIIG